MLLVFLAIVGLRVAIGFHFFHEGTSKLKSGAFTSAYFLRAAKGPLAPMYHSLLDDESGRMRLCVVDAQDKDGHQQFEFDTELTEELWRDFADRARSYYRFGDTDQLKQLADRRSEWADQIREARRIKDKSVDTAKLERMRDQAEQDILAIRQQNDLVDEIVDVHVELLRDWLAENQSEIFQHFATANRLIGFDRDGEHRDQVAIHVASLREQVDSIRKDRRSKFAGWISEVEAMWDSVETQVNGLAVDWQAKQAPLQIHRHFAQRFTKLKLIDQFIPWFDTTVGVLLILGLFTRFAALAGGLFLLSVVASQPPWIPGTADSFYQIIEMLALFVLFATCAGRAAGLDYFINSARRRNASQSNSPENQS